MIKLFEFNFYRHENPFSVPEVIRLQVCEDAYMTNGRRAFPILTMIGEPFAMLSVNLVDEPLDESKNEVHIKSWAENKDIADQLRNSKWFTDTGRRVPTGWVEAEVWIFNRKEVIH